MKTSSLLCLGLLLVCSSAAAQVTPPRLPVVPPGEDKIEYVPEGEPAPYSGYLYDPSTAVRWGNWLQFWKKTYVIDLTEQKKVCAVRTETQKRIYTIDLEAKNRVIEEQRKRLEQAQRPPWYQTVWFGAGAGAVGAFSVTLLSVWAVGQVSK